MSVNTTPRPPLGLVGGVAGVGGSLNPGVGRGGDGGPHVAEPGRGGGGGDTSHTRGGRLDRGGLPSLPPRLQFLTPRSKIKGKISNLPIFLNNSKTVENREKVVVYKMKDK